MPIFLLDPVNPVHCSKYKFF